MGKTIGEILADSIVSSAGLLVDEVNRKKDPSTSVEAVTVLCQLGVTMFEEGHLEGGPWIEQLEGVATSISDVMEQNSDRSFNIEEAADEIIGLINMFNQ